MRSIAQPPRVERALAELADRLRRRWGRDVVLLQLFGSRARGEADAASDVDVAVVLEHADWNARKELLDLAADIGREHGLLLSPTIFDRATYERYARQERPLVMAIEREGIAL